MTELDLLRAVRTRLSDPARWTHDTYARTVTGEQCDAFDPSAACWCAAGALIVESLTNYGARALAGQCLAFQAKRLGFRNEVHLNDASDHATVLAMIDAAMETGEVAR